jgi:hypothetical protein
VNLEPWTFAGVAAFRATIVWRCGLAAGEPNRQFAGRSFRARIDANLMNGSDKG